MHDAWLCSQYHKIWRRWDPEQRKVVNCSDVEFDENQTAHISCIDNENDALGLPEQEPIYTEEQVAETGQSGQVAEPRLQVAPGAIQPRLQVAPGEIQPSAEKADHQTPVTAAVLQGTRVSSGDASGSGSGSGGGTGTGMEREREWEREREREGNGNGNGRQRRTASDGRVGEERTTSDGRVGQRDGQRRTDVSDRNGQRQTDVSNRDGRR